MNGKAELAKLMEEKARRNNQTRLHRLYAQLYDWQRKFCQYTNNYTSCMLMAANQCVAAHTPIMVKTEKGVRSPPFLESLFLEDACVLGWADGSLHDPGTFAAYFQGIFPTVRLYLSNGQFLDCTGEHRVLADEGNYRTIQALLFGSSDPHYIEIDEDYWASCGEDGCQYDQPLHGPSDICRALFPSLADAQRHSRQASLRKDVMAHIDQYSLASLSGDLRTTPGALRRVEDLCGKFSSCDVWPTSRQMTLIRQVSEQLNAGVVDLPQSDDVDDLSKRLCCDGADSSRIFFPLPIPLANEVSIIAWQGIGCQPCFDYSVPDFNNYVSSGVVSHNCGKTRTGCLIDAYHLLGEYPDDWPGHTFERPPLMWLLGFSGVKTRDLLQAKLFGRIQGGQLTGGYVPADRIIDYKAMTGTSGACHEVRVQHKKGISVCQFWSYSQGQHALMGDVIDWYHIDEEPEDPEIFPQVLTRTINGDRGRGGRGILTLTPENGKTELVTQFMDNPQEGQIMMTATWDDAPHLSEQQKSMILSQYPPHQRDMRSRGIPLMGTGLIFQHSEDNIRCKRFEIPGHWYLINGMDFGWDHPQAHVQLAIDPETASIYITHAYKASKTQPYEAWHIVKPWAEGVPTAWPHDGLQTRQQSGQRGAMEQKAMYQEEGWEMLSEHATWPEGGNDVWVGIMKMNDLMASGKFKIFDDLPEVLEEIREYHTKQTSSGVAQIVKIKDDLIDSIRTGIMMARYAERKSDIIEPYWEDQDEIFAENAMGY